MKRIINMLIVAALAMVFHQQAYGAEPKLVASKEPGWPALSSLPRQAFLLQY